MTMVIHKPKLTPEIIAELEALEAMPDSEINLTDMPEVTDWSNWTRGKFYRPVKKQLTLRLDHDLIQWFKTRAGGARGYQTQINAALRKFVNDEMKRVG